MAGVTTSKSPLHEKLCVVGSTLVGVAVGRMVPLIGMPVGAAAGAVIGMAFCSRDSVSKPMGNMLEFDRFLKEVSSNAETQSKAIEAMVDRGYAKDKLSGALMLKHALAEAKTHPKHVHASVPKSPMTPTGRSAHGLDHLARKTNAVASAIA